MTIHHDEARQRFWSPTDHGDAVVDYRRTDGTVDFVHTYVPPEARGRGHAEALVRRALEWAENEQLEIHASCWYVARFRAAHAGREQRRADQT